MKRIAHTINREGKVVPANGFKETEKPEVSPLHNNSPIWMHSIDRQDGGGAINGFAILILLGMSAVAIMIAMAQ